MDIDRLIEANKNLVDKNNILKKDIEVLESRITKALKYIEKYSHYNAIPYELYEILKGDKDE